MELDMKHEKRCPSCTKYKPLLPEFWHRNKARPDGFSSICKDCKKIADQERHRKNHSMSRLDRLKKKAIKDLKKRYKEEAISGIYHDVKFIDELHDIENAKEEKDLV